MTGPDEPPDAPGAPGIEPTWSSSAKDVVGCSLGSSRIWYTTGYGIVNEVFSPRIDLPQIRDLGFIVADGRGFWVELKRMDRYEMTLPAPGIPVAEVVHRHPRFELRLRIVPDRRRPVLLVEAALTGDRDLLPYVLLAPHLGGTGLDNRAQIRKDDGRTILGAEHAPFGLALAGSDPDGAEAFARVSAGYVGFSDGWQDFSRNGSMTWEHPRAGPGNVALTAELSRRSVLALGIEASQRSASTLALSALEQDFGERWEEEIGAWRTWQATCEKLRNVDPSREKPPVASEFHTSAMVLRVHQDKTFPGAMVASLSVPWGNRSDDVGGYHLVWPRDLVESAGALLALGAHPEARDALRYLMATQKPDGCWQQNQWLGGTPYWSGVQLDETGFPVLLASALSRAGALDGIDPGTMVRAALRFIAVTGPSTDQDRWEEDRGVNTFTLAVCIAALVCGAELLRGDDRKLARQLADFWNSRIEEWTTVSGTELARRTGVDRYYVRVAPRQVVEDRHALARTLAIKNHTQDPSLPADEQVGVDFLQLVRFGLRAPDDPVVLDSLRVADALLKVETPKGPSWHRYNGDGYGEHDDGAPFDGTGRGRAWPLLTGERGHYEVSLGEDGRPYLEAMAAMAGRGGLIPEQVWDAAPLAGRELRPGEPTGSAMPLVWAHAEYVKLLASVELGRPFDRPAPVWHRYRGRRPPARTVFWTPSAPLAGVDGGTRLSLLLPDAALVHWSLDDWSRPRDDVALPTGLGLFRLDFPARVLARGSCLVFTFRWDDSGRWEGRDYRVSIGDRSAEGPARGRPHSPDEAAG